ncbi:MAG: Lrp/AsnC family transcriptional regulator [Syntrophomonadaceae bacterium]|jgi:DNA-binding Lrp family transcriptional regulator|nr:Lrp/AsnC family transcriptional regulator [Syntrophomonadaceae bacterium]
MDLKLKILNLIERDAKLSARTIATMLDEEEATIAALIKKMEDEKIILGYNTMINWDKLGDDGVTAMIEVKVMPEREVGFNRIAERICRFPEVKSVQLMSGTYDLSVIVTGKTMKDISWFVSHKLSTLDQIQSTVTLFILKTYKQEHVMFDEDDDDKRLVVSP